MSELNLIVHKFHEDVKQLNIYPIADAQIGSANFDESLLDAWIKKVMEDENSAVIIAGDMLNNGLKASKTNVYREKMTPRESKKYLYEKFLPIKDKILVCVTGNHEVRSINEADNDPLEDLMTLYGKEDLYRENIGFLKLKVGTRKLDVSKQVSYTFCVVHGVSKKKTEDFGLVVDNMDIMISGHIHQPNSNFPAKYVIDPHNEKVRLIGYTHITVPSFDVHGGYALRGLYKPQDSNKMPIIALNGEKKEVEVRWINVKST